jgi:hypothetical protein
MKFEVLAGDVVIGWSHLEYGDPPMGVAHGKLIVTSAYGATPPNASLRVRPVGEPFFEPVGGVHIEDLRADFGPDEIEVSVLGLDHETYARYFPHHVRSYKEQFTPSSDR